MLYFTTCLVVSLHVALTNCFKMTITPTYPANIDPVELESIEGEGGKGGFGKVIFATDEMLNTFAVKYVSQVAEFRQSQEKFDKIKASQEEALRNEYSAYDFMFKKSGGNLPRGIPKLHYYGTAEFEVDKDHKYQVLVIDYFPYNLSQLGNLNNVKPTYFSEKTIRRVTSDLIETLAIFQTWGMVHQDLKPENIMIGYDGYPRIIDYGLSVIEDGDTKTIKGSLIYQRQKCLTGASVPTSRSDLAALVTTMVECKIGLPSLIKKFEAKKGIAPKKDEVKYNSLKEDWWLPFSRSQFHLDIQNAFKSTASLKTVMKMHEDAENGDDSKAIPYSEFAAELA